MYVRAYLSQGYKLDPTDERILVGTDQIKKGNLNAGTCKNEYFNIDLATLKNGRPLDPGIYNLVVWPDRKWHEDNGDGEVPEKHKSNNRSTELVFEVVADPTLVPPSYNLTPANFRFLETPLYAGDFARLGASIRHTGNAPLPSGFRSSYTVFCNGAPELFLTDDGTDAQDVLPGGSTWEETLIPVRMPDTPGNCRAFFRVDYQGKIAESDEGDNVASLDFVLLPRPFPDLIITYVGIGDYNDTSIRKGNNKHPTMRIKNVGPGPVTASIRSAYYWCTASLVCSYIDGDTTEPYELCVGCEMKERIDRDWSASKTGTFYLKACADINNTHPETNEENNCRLSSPITVKSG